MPITTYTELEISLQTRITELLKEANVWSVEYSLVKAEKIRLMANSYTIRRQLAEAQALIEASRKQESVAWKYTHVQSGYTEISIDHPEKMDEWNDMQLWHTKPLFAAPVVADDVLKDAQRYRWLRDNSSSISWNPSRFNSEIVSGFSHNGTGCLGFNFEDAIDEAMGVAA